MTVLFCGGELDDFTIVGSVAFNTSATGSYFRSTYARGSVDITGGAAFGVNYVRASFTASSAFSATWRSGTSSAFTAGNVLAWLATGGSARLRLKLSSTSPSTIVLESYTSGGVATTLATSVNTITSANSTSKYDWIVDYQVAGRVRLYVDQVLFIDYSGDVTASSATTLDSLNLGPFNASSGAALGRHSEVVVCTQDSRTLSLVTLAPNAAGTGTTWTSGAYTDIDETTASEVDVIVSGTANQIFNANCTGMPSGWANLSVTAIKVIASAARGATGPSKLAVGCRTNSADSFPASVTIDTGYTTPYTTYYETNPVTAIAWTTGEVDAFQIALKSET